MDKRLSGLLDALDMVMMRNINVHLGSKPTASYCLTTYFDSNCLHPGTTDSVYCCQTYHCNTLIPQQGGACLHLLVILQYCAVMYILYTNRKCKQSDRFSYNFKR
jgi:hypothetical protein